MIHAARCRLLSWQIYWRTRAKRKDCFHHDRLTGESWISDQLIDVVRVSDDGHEVYFLIDHRNYPTEWTDIPGSDRLQIRIRLSDPVGTIHIRQKPEPNIEEEGS